MKRLTKLEDLAPDPANANEGTLRGHQILDASIERFGAGRSIVTDKNGLVIGGSKTLEAAVDHQLTAKIVPSDGSKLIVVQRVDLDLEETPEARQLAYVDNRAHELNLHWNPQQLENDLASGVELGGLFTQEERESLLAAIDTRERQTTLVFDDAGQRAQFLALIEIVGRTYPDEATFGARLHRWVDAQLARLDSEPV